MSEGKNGKSWKDKIQNCSTTRFLDRFEKTVVVEYFRFLPSPLKNREAFGEPSCRGVWTPAGKFPIFFPVLTWRNRGPGGSVAVPGVSGESGTESGGCKDRQTYRQTNRQQVLPLKAVKESIYAQKLIVVKIWFFIFIP